MVALGGMVVPIAIYLAINRGRSSASGWGTAMSTDTAFALGALALVGPGVPDRVRTYLLTFALADDVAGIVVIALAYSGHIDLTALAAGAVILGVVMVARWRGVRNGPAYLLLGVAAWVAFFESGVDPVVVGLAMGLLAVAYPAARSDLEQASESFRLFREQPEPELARDARESVRLAISPNDRLQQLFHPWTSYLIVPLFALANAGITVSGSFLAHAYTSPVTLGILLGYVAGKPAGTVGAAWLLARVSRGAIRPPVGWAAVTGAGAVAGIGFIVSLLIASLAFHGSQLAEAKVGILSAAVCASALGWAVFRLTALLPKRLRARALLGTADTIIDLAVPVDAERDHVRGPDRAPVTLVEYGGFEAPTAAGPSRWSGSSWPTTETCATYGGTCRSPTCTARATRGRGRRGRGRPGQVLADARPAAGPPGRADGQGPDPVRRRARPGHRPVHPRPAQPRRAGQDRRGRGLRRPERRLRHAHVLRQRQAAPRRLRHQHPSDAIRTARTGS